MLLFGLAPKVTQKARPTRTAWGCWLWRVATTLPTHRPPPTERMPCMKGTLYELGLRRYNRWHVPSRAVPVPVTRPSAAVGASGGFLVRVASLPHGGRLRRGRLENKKAPEISEAWWELRDSNPRPSACKADALNQLS